MKITNNKCIICKYHKYNYGNNKFVKHHTNGGRIDTFGNKFGKIIILCTYHHNGLHGFVKTQLLKEAMNKDKRLFEKYTLLYINKITPPEPFTRNQTGRRLSIDYSLIIR